MKNLLAVTSAVLLAMGGTALAQSQSGTGGMHRTTGQSPSAMSDSSAAGAHRASADQVKQAQNQLKQQGFYNGAIDGVVGPQTKSAISEFQKKQGLRPTASLDQETMSRLTSAGVGSGSSAMPSTSGGAGAMPGVSGPSGMSPPSAPDGSAPGASSSGLPSR